MTIDINLGRGYMQITKEFYIHASIRWYLAIMPATYYYELGL